MNEAKLIISDSDKNSNMFYAAGIIAPDDFIYLENNNCKTIYVNPMEFNRVQKESKADKVINYLKYFKNTGNNFFSSALGQILEENKIKKVLVPENFKIKYAKILEGMKIEIDIKKEPFFEERLSKSEKEVKDIVLVQKINEKAMAKAIDILKKSKTRKDKKLIYDNKVLTSEILKEAINIEFFRGNCIAEINIVSSGKDTADPHELGRGPIRADQPIIIDIFPRSQKSRYFSDMTRTVVKGKASSEIKKIYQAVLEAQRAAIRKIKPGEKCSVVHGLVEEYFKSRGFETLKEGKIIQGFIHGAGHGVGLDIHEPPFISGNSNDILQEGNIVTVEPGLYYPGIGGVRIEDLVAVTEKGCKNLTKFPKFLEIP